jgi:hypothetical protein
VYGLSPLLPAQTLYAPHVPGGYADAELDLHPDLAVDEKTLGDPFKDPSGRNPTYQGAWRGEGGGGSARERLGDPLTDLLGRSPN